MQETLNEPRWNQFSNYTLQSAISDKQSIDLYSSKINHWFPEIISFTWAWILHCKYVLCNRNFLHFQPLRALDIFIRESFFESKLPSFERLIKICQISTLSLILGRFLACIWPREAHSSSIWVQGSLILLPWFIFVVVFMLILFVIRFVVICCCFTLR